MVWVWCDEWIIFLGKILLSLNLVIHDHYQLHICDISKILDKSKLVMVFCQCGKWKKSGHDLCSNCDKSKPVIEDKIIWERETKSTKNIIIDESLSFEKNQFYTKKEVWQEAGVSNQGGIRLNKDGNFLIVFMDAPELYRKPSSGSNIYHDTFDDKTGLYHYTGAGQKKDQTLDKENGWLANAEQNNRSIHFFRQFNVGKKHQYIGQVQVEKIISSEQPDNTGKPRRVYIFFLRPKEE